MHTIESIRNFCLKIGFKPSNTNSEIKELPNILHHDEELKGLLEGSLKRVHNRDFNGTGLAIVTNKRIIFYRKSIIGTETKEELPLNKVSSTSYRKGLLLSSVAIISSNNEALIDNCNKIQSKVFNNTIQLLINTSKEETNTNPYTLKNNDLDELEKLFDLKQKGAITEEEFALLKNKIINS
ncbi:PH domain-containing protein [Myroides odoratus]|uniref:SHOCT domain-containing protein n=1 Tax=Myroides odoratus TaxID=256 RepID=A0A378RQH2_MYROD|nr:PH domain-containing protein [Myroides odoratus]QQU04006.1 PH domain-containing protein [Myroides odoratus]STZ28609.1 Uncharacterised protein [Myroides odoratus]